jgi:hypothetical protein
MSEKTFQRSFKRLNVKKVVHNVLKFYRFNNHDSNTSTPPLTCSHKERYKRGNKGAEAQIKPLPGFKLDSSDSDTMLEWTLTILT